MMSVDDVIFETIIFETIIFETIDDTASPITDHRYIRIISRTDRVLNTTCPETQRFSQLK
jgi:hypothetical protein